MVSAAFALLHVYAATIADIVIRQSLSPRRNTLRLPVH